MKHFVLLHVICLLIYDSSRQSHSYNLLNCEQYEVVVYSHTHTHINAAHVHACLWTNLRTL